MAINYPPQYRYSLFDQWDKDAFELIKKIAKTGNHVLIKTVKSDKYDRYLADVWVGETYVNQALIDQGLAVRVNG